MIDNNSYVIISWSNSSEKLKIKEYDKARANNIVNNVNNAISVNGLGKAVLAGLSSSFGQSLLSKGLSNSATGRVMSSIYSIASDGKIENEEIWYSFIDSMTNELDSTAIDLGYPTATALYNAIGPSGSGIIASDFLNGFIKSTNTISDDVLGVENDNKIDQLVIKIKLINSDDESYSSNLPERKVESGYSYIKNIDNIDPEYNFQGIIGGIGHDIYDIKDNIIYIRNSKVPFDVYINDSKNNKQYIRKNCLFNNLSFGTDSSSSNSKTISFSFKEINEFIIDAGETNKRTQSTSNAKSVSNKIKNSKKTSGSTRKSISTNYISEINDVKNMVRLKLSGREVTSLSVDEMCMVASQLAQTGLTPAQVGITPTSAGTDLNPSLKYYYDDLIKTGGNLLQ